MSDKDAAKVPTETSAQPAEPMSNAAAEATSSEPEDQGEALPPKQDPSALVLRGQPRKVSRFRREVIIAGAALGAITVAGGTWFAFRPHDGTVAVREEGLAENTQMPDVLAGAPRTYGDVPQLGPPLPGDLGRPILKRQRELGEGPEDAEASEASRRAAEAAETQRQRLLAERKAARESGLMAQLADSSRVSGNAAPLADDPESPEQRSASSAERQVDRADEAEARRTNGNIDPRARAGSGANADAVETPASPWTLSAGTVIAASLITGLNSDLPGIVTAQVTESCYDSVTGRSLLIPQGARLIGRYNSDVAYGQKRAFLAWQRIVFPDGSSVTLDDVPASDASGYAGLNDRVDFHTGRLLKGVALATLLGVGTELSFGGDEAELAEAIRESAQTNADRAGQQITARNLDIAPTITVRPGWPLRVIVQKDLVLSPWAGREE